MHETHNGFTNLKTSLAMVVAVACSIEKYRWIASVVAHKNVRTIQSHSSLEAFRSKAKTDLTRSLSSKCTKAKQLVGGFKPKTKHNIKTINWD